MEKSEVEWQIDEARLKAVEEAVIKIGNVIDIVVVDIKARVKVLEDNDKKFVDEVNTSCNIKDKQIADGDNKTFWKCMSVVTGLFFMFVGALLYFNTADGVLHEKINDYHTTYTTDITRNTTNIHTVEVLLKEIRDIVRDNSKHTHDKDRG